MEIGRDNLVTTLPYLGKEYKISLDVFLNKLPGNIPGFSYPYRHYRAFTLFTVGEPNMKYGSRIPLVCHDGLNLLIKTPRGGDVRNAPLPYKPRLVAGKWYSIEISQRLVNKKVREKLSYLNLIEEEFNNDVLVYARNQGKQREYCPS